MFESLLDNGFSIVSIIRKTLTVLTVFLKLSYIYKKIYQAL